MNRETNHKTSEGVNLLEYGVNLLEYGVNLLEYGVNLLECGVNVLDCGDIWRCIIVFGGHFSNKGFSSQYPL